MIFPKKVSVQVNRSRSKCYIKQLQAGYSTRQANHLHEKS